MLLVAILLLPLILLLVLSTAPSPVLSPCTPFRSLAITIYLSVLSPPVSSAAPLVAVLRLPPSMWKQSFALLPTLLLLWATQVSAANFTFSYGTATSCDDFEVSWTGTTILLSPLTRLKSLPQAELVPII